MKLEMQKEEKITIHNLFWYFVIFSVIGIIIETAYCYITTGVLESRKGLIWGPFCPVYGISAVIATIFLNKYKNENILKLFVYGFVTGSIAEYILSYILEAIYGMRFWDYSYTTFHINGRICLQFSFYWGILSVILIKWINPLLNKLIAKIPTKPRNIIEIILLIFFIINAFFTMWGIQTYENRVVNGIENEQETSNIFETYKQKIENEYFTNERISIIFPNIRTIDEEGREVWVKTLIEN